ncbi:MAG: cytochrome c biogenesis protein CcdA [Ilumatobacteraceae bacterium]
MAAVASFSDVSILAAGLTNSLSIMASWSPCVGPLLGAALTAASVSGSTWRGSWQLFTFGCGVLTPFCALACLRLARFGPRVAAVGRRLSSASVVVVLVLGVLLLAGWYDAVIQRLDIGT